MSLYLYAISQNPDFLNPDFQNSAIPETLGMNEQPVQFHEISPFVIIYSKATQARYLASRAHLLNHERVIEAVMNLNNQDVPLPLRFGLVVDDWEEVAQKLILGHQNHLQSLLNKLKGKREVGIKLFWDQLPELNLILEKNSSLNHKREALLGKTLSMDEAIAIGKELESALDEARQDIIDDFIGVLQPLACEFVTGELLTESMLFNAAFLIDWDLEPQFAEAVEKLDAKYDNRLRIRYNNFTAPFNFVNLDNFDQALID